MTTSSTFDLLMDRVGAGERLGVDDLAQLAATPDILQLGMLAGYGPAQLHGAQVTYLRVALCPYDKPFTDAVPLAAREVRVTGTPDRSRCAIRPSRRRAPWRASARVGVLVAGRREAAASVAARVDVLERLRSAGLDALPSAARSHCRTPRRSSRRIVAAGYRQMRLTIDKAPADVRANCSSAPPRCRRSSGASVRSIRCRRGSTRCARRPAMTM
jgi:hypothetical protein